MFIVPKATFPPFGARVMDLQNPTRKMSKSEDSPQGTIGVLEDPKAITKKIKSAVTDSDTEVRHDRDAKPGVSNLIEIYAAVTGSTIAAVEKEFGDGGYGTFKVAVAEAVVEYLRPVQERYEALAADPGEVDRLLAVGAAHRGRDRRRGARPRDRSGRPAPACELVASGPFNGSSGRASRWWLPAGPGGRRNQRARGMCRYRSVR